MLVGAKSPRILIAALAFALACKALFDSDVWWHLAAGRWMWEHHAVVRADPFSQGFQGQPWVSIPWAHEVLSYLLYAVAGGPALLTLAFAALASATIFVAFSHFLALGERDEKRAWAGFLVFLAALPLAELRWRDRPESWTQLFGALFLLILHGDATGRVRKEWLRALPLLQILWANLHGLFAFGPFFTGVFLAEAVWKRSPRRRELAIVFAAVVAACAVNPRFLEGALYPLHLLQVLFDPGFQELIGEAASPFSGEWHALQWGIAGWSACVAAAAWRRSEAVWALAAILVLLTFQAVRNVGILVPWMLPFVADSAAALAIRVAGSKVPAIRGIALTAGAIFAGVLGLGAYHGRLDLEQSGLGVTRSLFPERLSRFLERLPESQGPVFADVTSANALLFFLPGFRSFIDSRFAEVYPYSHLESYARWMSHPALLSEELRKRNFSVVVLSHLGRGNLACLAELTRGPEWELRYLDEVAAVFVRARGTAPRPSPDLYGAALAGLETETGGTPGQRARGLFQLGQALGSLGEFTLARRAFSSATRLAPGEGSLWVESCQLSYLSATRNADEVESTCKQALARGNRDPRALKSLGLLYLNSGRRAEAGPLLREALSAKPDRELEELVAKGL